jgi:drug/metabolite transporter (DMT)-like permease
VPVKFHPIDAALLLMTIIWGSNFTVVKIAVRYIPELPFNGLRLLVGSAAFLVTLAAREGLPRLTRPEWRRIVQLAVVGHFVYQFLFLAAVARTTVANSSLIFAFTPITVALLTSALGHERVPPTRWLGALISLAGIYLVVSGGSGLVVSGGSGLVVSGGSGLVVGGRGDQSGATMLGNVLAVCAMVCWAVYTVGARPLLASRSALLVTGYTVSLGSLFYLPLALPGLAALDWAAVPASAWLALIASALLALFLSYMIWYTAVQRLGNTRTVVYSNVTPLVAMAVAAIWLGEPITFRKLIGAAAVIAGLAVSRLEPKAIAAPEA